MRILSSLAAGLALALLSGPAQSEASAPHRFVDPATIQWGPGPPALEPGPKAALLYGDPNTDGLFVIRLWIPKGFRVAPHTHPRPEILTIISGSFLLGLGADADQAKTRRLGTGSFSALAPDMPHYAFTDEDTVIQISTTGPWVVNYLNPADDPRNKAKMKPERG